MRCRLARESLLTLLQARYRRGRRRPKRWGRCPWRYPCCTALKRFFDRALHWSLLIKSSIMIRQDFVKGRGFVNYSTRLWTCPTVQQGGEESQQPNNEIELIGQVDSQHIISICIRVTYSMSLCVPNRDIHKVFTDFFLNRILMKN